MRGWNVLYSVIFFSLAICSCNLFDKKENKTVKEDYFYTNKGGLDRPRIPLIKPYELLKVSANEWRMELQTMVLSLSVHNIKGVNVSQGKILLYSNGGTEIRLGENIKSYEEAWFIIDASKQEEKAFVNHAEYQDALVSTDLADTTLLPPDPLYKNFYSSGKLKWQP